MMFDRETLGALASLAARLKCETAVLQAVVEVESNSKAFARVKGRDEPLIRWEGHYFDRRLKGEKRDRARAAGLAHPTAGKVKNPESQAARWEMVHRAAAIDRLAALESFSIGVGQVMTAHWRKLGFRSVDAMIERGRSGLAGQIELMALYIEKFGLADELQRKDFTAFARGYNGPNYAAGGYHTKMAAAYRRISGGAPVSAATGMLRMGSKGEKVRELQALLIRAGYPVGAKGADGDFGPSTKAAVAAFQRAQRITADGVAGPQTLRRLEAWRRAPDEEPGKQGVTETPEAKEGLGGIAGGVSVEVAKQAVEQAAEKTSIIPGLEWLSGILSVIAVLLVLGGLAWIAWGWWKSRRTDEGDVVPPPYQGDAFAPAEADPVLP